MVHGTRKERILKIVSFLFRDAASFKSIDEISSFMNYDRKDLISDIETGIKLGYPIKRLRIINGKTEVYYQYNPSIFLPPPFEEV